VVDLDELDPLHVPDDGDLHSRDRISHLSRPAR
jgi:hypothetical protein